MFQKQMIIEQPEYFKKLVPLSSDLVKVKSANDKLVIDTIANKNKYIIVCGPCSADDRIAVTEYCRQLKNLSDRVKDKILLIPRIYTVKPHSSGNGYLGILFHKNKYETPDIRNGIIECRKLFIKCIELGMPI
ncbi:MAG: 3-deoxy-7-phosphoheptulonate synthase, partial [Clostridia bacterium]